MKTVRIDLSLVNDRESFHDIFASALGFPGFYGRNMDAWIDCMSYIDEPGAAMSTVHVERGEVLTIQLEEVDGFAARCPDLYADLIECAALVNLRRTREGEPAILALSFRRHHGPTGSPSSPPHPGS